MKNVLRAVAVVGLASACARPVDHTPPPSRPVPLGSAGVAPGAPSVPWSGKSFEQRMEFMGLTFHPRMKELFQDYDATEYGNFRCQTCHGEDMEARRFAMPASLRPASEAADAGARDRRAMEFMVSKVLPETRELLADDGAHGAARVGCNACHPRP